MEEAPRPNSDAELNVQGHRIIASVTINPLWSPHEFGSIVTVVHYSHGEKPIASADGRLWGEGPDALEYPIEISESSPEYFFSAYWLTKQVSPEQMVAAVKAFYSGLAGKISPQHPSYFYAQANEERELGPIPLEKILQEHLRPSSVQHMFRICSAVDVWAAVEGMPNAEAGILSAHSLPLESVLAFYHSTSGLDLAVPPKGLDALTEAMKYFKPL